MMEEELLRYQTFESNKKIDQELARFRAQGIKYEFRPFGSKWMAFIELTDGFKLLVCPYNKTVTYRSNRRLKYKHLGNWIKQAGLTIK